MSFRNAAKSVLFPLLFVPGQLAAQAIFQPIGFPKTVTATGHTEVIGSVNLALKLGPTIADTLLIDLSPLPITNGAASDVVVAVAGNITVGTITIDAAAGQVRLPMNAGGSSGSIRIDGIRTSVAGTKASSVVARLSWVNHFNFFDGRDSVVVVDQVRSGLTVDPMTDNFRIFANVVIDNTATLVVREGYEGAFVDSRQFGQNISTRIRIRVSDFPSGLKMLFPARVSASETAAALTTVEGTAIELPRQDGSTEVTYSFTSAANSSDITESFKIPFTVSATGPVELLQPTIEASLAPIGAAVPSVTLPSTNVPRYAEENVVGLEGSSRIISKTLYWNGIDSSGTNVVSLFNGESRVANVTLTAFRADGQLVAGTNVTNPSRQSLTANQSSNLNLADVFGQTASLATVRVQSTSSDLLALATISASGLSESLPLMESGLPNFVIPAVGEETRINLFNPGASVATGTLSFRGQSGATLATTTITLAALGSDSRSVRDLIGSAPAVGQIVGSFSIPVLASTSFGTASTLNLVAAQAPNLTGSMYVPFFATGAGFETDLNFVNSSSQTVNVSLQLLNGQGSPIGTSQSIMLGPSGQAVTTVSQMFQLSSFATGYVRIQVPQGGFGPFISYPAITGYERLRSGQAASTVIPFAIYPMTDSAVLNSGTSTGTYQGVALLNPSSATATVTLQALSNTGSLLGTATVNLAAGQISSKQISEYFSVSIPEGSVIRVYSSVPIVTTSITGSMSGDTLRSTPGLK